MSDPNNPFDPEIVPSIDENGISGISFTATTNNYSEAPLPVISTHQIQPNDHLLITYNNDRIVEFIVDDTDTGSLTFGSEGIHSPQVTFSTTTSDGQTERSILYGAAITTVHSMLVKNSILAGAYLATDRGLSEARLKDFELKRPDDNGDLESVRLNKQDSRSESASFSAARAVFTGIEALLAEAGFKFDDKRGDITLQDGTIIPSNRYASFRAVHDNSVLDAVQQGFATALVPQREIWTYDAAAEVLRALRDIPTRGQFQIAVAEEVSTDIFEETGHRRDAAGKPDWRGPIGSTVNLHLLCRETPVTSYTWLASDQVEPIITILDDGAHYGDLLRTSHRQGSMQYDKLEVDIRPGEEPEPRIGSIYAWSDAESAQVAAERVKEVTRVTYGEGHAIIAVGDHEISFPTDVHQQLADLTEIAHQALGVRSEAVTPSLSAKLLKYIRKNKQ